VTGGTHDQEAIHLAALTDDQRAGLACVNCGTARRGAMRPITTPRTLRAQLVVHADIGVCLLMIAGYLVGLHGRLLDAAEHTVAVLTSADDANDP
jgi:hypothetical protein